MKNNQKKKESDLRYLQLLSQTFPTIADASTEIINLQAILNLPKGTEHFLADLHGEYKSFQHVLRNASGNIKRKVNDIFGNEMRETEKKELCTLIYTKPTWTTGIISPYTSWSRCVATCPANTRAQR